MGSGAAGGSAAAARWRVAVVALVAVVAIAGGLAWIFADKPDAATDDAYVSMPKTLVSPKVRGMVVDVLAQENRPVKVGDLLVKIDPQEYDLKLAQAEGDLMAAEASEKAGKAGLARLDAETKLAEGQVKGAQALAGAKGLADPVLRQAFQAAQGQALVAARTRGEIEAGLAQATAAKFRAKTELTAAKLEQAATQVTAPTAGVVADIQATPGGLVQPGVTLMTIIDPSRPTISANFKETQVGRMRPG